MPGVFHFLRCVGKAVVKHGLRALANLIPLGDVIYDVASDALHDYRDESRDAELRADLEAVAQAPPEQVRHAAEQVVQAIAADQPVEVQINLVSYLSQLPPAIRQSLRRPSDPSGTTVPATLSFRQPADLMPFLPARLPHFKAGDRPLLPVEWELVELLGIGGFGEVWKARHLTLRSKKPVALKFCLDKVAADSLRHEANVLDRVMHHGSHPGIVPLLQTYLGAATPCLEYELVEGGDLAGLVQEMASRGTPSPRLACDLVLNLARTVAFFHRLSPPLVHRDLKPANILVQRQQDGTFLLRVADFGIGGAATSHLVREQATRPSAGQTLPTVLRGAHTPLYASRQQKKGDPPDPRDDVHALGVIWYQALCGNVGLERPSGKGWRKTLLAGGMTEPLLELLQRCLDDEADERPADAQVLVEELTPLLPVLRGAAGRGGGPAPDPVPELLRQHRYAEVLQELEKVSRDRRDYGRIVEVRRQWQAHAEQQAALRAEADDCEAAVAVLEALPAPLQNAGLLAGYRERLEEARSRRDEEAALVEEIEQGVTNHQTDWLRPSVEKLQRLNPRHRLCGMLRTLPEIPKAFSNSLGMKLVLVQPGKFLMGSPNTEAERGEEEGPQHEVEITRPFYLGACQVTQEEYQKVTGRNPSYFAASGGGKDTVKGMDTRRFPVEQVSWGEAVEFCRLLTEKEAGSGRLYRLPTEAEWEYACRGGQFFKDSAPFYFAKPSPSLSSKQANFDGKYPYGGAAKGPDLKRTTAVGSYQANALGLSDMHGNVWEWCADRYDPAYYQRSPKQDPQGPESSSENRRVLRGGSWYVYGRNCRAAYRFWGEPGNRYNCGGFRVVLVVGARTA
jgi:formylglycine-generating enzyme required for sulfatase activity/serine/threonine protein kinase